MASQDIDIAKLIDRVALADRAAFDALYGASSAKLFGVLLRILKDRAEAEDALQEVYVRVWQKAGRFRSGGGSGMGWLVAVARNHAIDRLRSRRPATDAYEMAAEVPDPGPTPEAAALRASDVGRLTHCLDQLEVEKSQAVQAAYIEGYTYQDLAARFDVPLNTMRTWLRRSLMKLKACLDDG